MLQTGVYADHARPSHHGCDRGFAQRRTNNADAAEFVKPGGVRQGLTPLGRKLGEAGHLSYRTTSAPQVPPPRRPEVANPASMETGSPSVETDKRSALPVRGGE